VQTREGGHGRKIALHAECVDRNCDVHYKDVQHKCSHSVMLLPGIFPAGVYWQDDLVSVARFIADCFDHFQSGADPS
jgi:hypothetical protein